VDLKEVRVKMDKINEILSSFGKSDICKMTLSSTYIL
jgi:hypothetical protein